MAAGPAESHGMEDARFVRFTDGEDLTYYATYTAFDGSGVASHLLETTDFSSGVPGGLSGPSLSSRARRALLMYRVPIETADGTGRGAGVPVGV